MPSANHHIHYLTILFKPEEEPEALPNRKNRRFRHSPLVFIPFLSPPVPIRKGNYAPGVQTLLPVEKVKDMRATRWLWCIVLVGGGLVASASAEQAVRWQVSLEAAKRLASQTNRLVLIHFWADWCQPCRRMEQEVFTQPEVASAIEAAFVPVRINVDHFPHTRQQYGVTVLPTDVIITPEGQPIWKMDGVADAAQYLARLNQIAAATNRGGMERQVAGPVAASADAGRPTPPYYGSPVNRYPEYPPSGPPSSPEDRYAGQVDRPEEAELTLAGPRYAGSARPALGGPAQSVPSVTIPPASDVARSGSVSVAPPGQSAAPPLRPGVASPGLAAPTWRSETPGQSSPPSMAQSPPPSIQIPPGNPPLGLDGYCPVELSERRRWVLGDPRWGLIHRERTYLFSGPEQRDRFDADPDRYAPVASGNDVVVLVERGQLTPGRREHGGWFDSRVYLFSGRETYLKFYTAPEQYVTTLREMSQQPNIARHPSGSFDFSRPVGGPAPQDVSRGWR